jgi:hypothetical protein
MGLPWFRGTTINPATAIPMTSSGHAGMTFSHSRADPADHSPQIQMKPMALRRFMQRR